jgi:ligand-binding sensor domain-containing protein
MKYDGDQWTNYTKKEGLVANELSLIYEDRQGGIWLGAFSEKRKWVNGLMKYNGQAFEIISRNPTQFIKEDSQGNIWSWSAGGRIVKWDGNKITQPSKKTGELPSNNVWSFCEASDNTIWIGTGKGLAINNGQNWRQIDAEKLHKRKPFAYSIILDNDEVLWFGTDNGVYSYDGEDWTGYYTSTSVMVKLEFEKLYIDSKANIWANVQKKENVTEVVGTSIWYFNENEWKEFSKISEAPRSKATMIFESAKGDMWFSTYFGGIHRFDGTSWKSFHKDQGFRSNHFQAIFEDSKGNIWLGLGDGGFSGEGISKYDGNDWTFYDKSTGLPSDRVFSIIEDANGNIWFATFQGVVQYTPSE